MIYNHIRVTIGPLCKALGPPINYQYDVTQILVIEGLTLPEYYEVDFCNEGDASTITIPATGDGVPIPDDFLLTGRPIKAYIVIAGSDNDVQTRYEITLPVNRRPTRSDIHPTPAEQLQIDQLIAVIGDAVADAQQSKSAAAGSAVNAAESAADALQSENEAETSALKSEGFAIGEQNGIDVSYDSPYYQNNSKYYAEYAETAAGNARRHANNASGYANNAEASAVAAGISAAEAAVSAKAAEQSAAQSGYLYFYIGDDGHLYMDRTPNTVVDFYLGNDGHLYVMEAA